MFKAGQADPEGASWGHVLPAFDRLAVGGYCEADARSRPGWLLSQSLHMRPHHHPTILPSTALARSGCASHAESVGDIKRVFFSTARKQ